MELRNQYYVSPTGSDRGDGTREHPFRSPYQARDAIREARKGKVLPKGGICVNLEAGCYPIRETLLFTEEDSGEKDSPITYCAPNGAAVWEAGTVLRYEDFRPASKAIRQRLRHTEVGSRLLEIDLKAAGVTGFENPRHIELFIDGVRATYSRYPSTGYMLTPADQRGTILHDVSGLVKTWKNIEDICFEGYFPVDYSLSRRTLVSVDAENDLVTLNDEVEENKPVRYTNVLEEIELPGEYSIDCKNGMLYVYPTENFADAQLMISQSDDRLMYVQGAEYLTFRGLTFEGSNAQEAIRVEGNDITIDSCVLQACGFMGLRTNGYRIRIVNNTIRYLGGSGMSLHGGDSKRMIASNTIADNNHIHHFAQRTGTYSPAIYCSDFNECGFRISHNEIHDSIHNGLLIAASDTVVEYNKIYNVCTEAADAGAIYLGRWEVQNLVIRYNYLYDCYNRFGLGSPEGIYCDDGGSGKVCYGNVLVNIGGSGYLMGGGNNMIVYNNLFVDIRRPITYDQRQYYGGWEEDWAQFPEGNDWMFLFHHPAFKSRAWVHRYPRMTLMKTTRVKDLEDPWVAGAVGNAVCRCNVEVNFEFEDLLDPATDKFAIRRDNVVYRTPEEVGFVDYKNGDFHLRPDSRVFKDLPSFVMPPIDEMGLRH